MNPKTHDALARNSERNIVRNNYISNTKRKENILDHGVNLFLIRTQATSNSNRREHIK